MSFYISSRRPARPPFDENRILTGYADEIVLVRVLSYAEDGSLVETEMKLRLLSPQLEVLIDHDGNVLVGV